MTRGKRGTSSTRAWWLLAGLAAGCATTNGDEDAAAAAGAASEIVLANFERPGYVVEEQDGRVWVFCDGSEEAAAFAAGSGAPEKHVTQIGALPGGLTVKAPDQNTLNGYLASREGFLVLPKDGRLWVFAQDSEEASAALNGEYPEKHVTEVGAGPGGVTLKSPSRDVIEGYLADR